MGKRWIVQWHLTCSPVACLPRWRPGGLPADAFVLADAVAEYASGDSVLSCQATRRSRAPGTVALPPPEDLATGQSTPVDGRTGRLSFGLPGTGASPLSSGKPSGRTTRSRTRPRPSPVTPRPLSTNSVSGHSRRSGPDMPSDVPGKQAVAGCAAGLCRRRPGIGSVAADRRVDVAALSASDQRFGLTCCLRWLRWKRCSARLRDCDAPARCRPACWASMPGWPGAWAMTTNTGRRWPPCETREGSHGRWRTGDGVDFCGAGSSSFGAGQPGPPW